MVLGAAGGRTLPWPDSTETVSLVIILGVTQICQNRLPVLRYLTGSQSLPMELNSHRTQASQGRRGADLWQVQAIEYCASLQPLQTLEPALITWETAIGNWELRNSHLYFVCVWCLCLWRKMLNIDGCSNKYFISEKIICLINESNSTFRSLVLHRRNPWCNEIRWASLIAQSVIEEELPYLKDSKAILAPQTHWIRSAWEGDRYLKDSGALFFFLISSKQSTSSHSN